MQAPSVRTDAQSKFVESAAILLEDLGLSRMSGRMLGWLLVCEPAHQSAAQLAAALSASAGSVSATTRDLVRLRLIERVAFPGERKDYFVMRPGIWWTLTRQRLLVVHAFRALTEAAAREIPRDTANARLTEMAEFYEFLERAMEEGLARWEAERGNAK